MKRFYQTGWLGIEFSSFLIPNKKKIADSDFYNQFYNAFLKRYSSYNDLDVSWILHKKRIADFIFEKFLSPYVGMDNTQHRSLSIGCGIGIVEKLIYEKGYLNFDITEVSNIPLKWIKRTYPNNQIFSEGLCGNFNDGQKYDFIYLGAVDYFFDDL